MTELLKKLVKPFVVFLALCDMTRAQDQPNIILILADDMGYDSVSANNDEMGELTTPHIDQLISEGMNFTDAHSGSAVCTPTRYGLLTGRYCWRTKLKSSVLWQYAAPLIEKERLTVAEMLRENSYKTAMFGKWHLGLDWRGADGSIVNGNLRLSDATFRKGEPADRIDAVAKRIDFSQPLSGGPTDHGFDYYWGVDVPNFAPYIWIENDRIQGDPSVEKPDSMFGSPGAMLPGWKLEEILPTLARKASDWISVECKTEQPFFLYLALTSPHTPIAPSAKFQGKSGISSYADFVMETDFAVGQVLNAVKAAGIADNTLVIFCADNGTSPVAKFKNLEKHGVNLRKHFKGHKAQIHEGGHRIPFVVRWPGKVSDGSVCHDVICLNDFMATVADIIGFDLPENCAEDSTSILALMTSKKSDLKDRPLVVNHDIGGNFAIRKGKWKLVGNNKLFNLTADPKESVDVSAQNQDVVKKLTETLNRYRGRE